MMPPSKTFAIIVARPSGRLHSIYGSNRSPKFWLCRIVYTMNVRYHRRNKNVK